MSGFNDTRLSEEASYFPMKLSTTSHIPPSPPDTPLFMLNTYDVDMGGALHSVNAVSTRENGSIAATPHGGAIDNELETRTKLEVLVAPSERKDGRELSRLSESLSDQKAQEYFLDDDDLLVWNRGEDD
jgi:hypothetical protein